MLFFTKGATEGQGATGYLRAWPAVAGIAGF